MLREVLVEGCRAVEGLEVHDGGTYVCMEGPAFSTIAESHMHRQWGAHLIGMTAMPEARLAREAEMCYATIALTTDYDVWREETDEVDVTDVLAILRQNQARVREALGAVIPAIPLEREADCDASRALEHAILTAPEAIPARARRELGVFLDKYLAPESADDASENKG
jgi:5'-methylthioadenosine phosphorylase